MIRYVCEMATVYKDDKYGICVTVNPDTNRQGDIYFKFYDSNSYTTADKVARIHFLKDEYVIHKNRDGEKNWKLSASDVKVLNTVLEKPSMKYKNCSVWDSAKFDWNNEYLDDMLFIDDYIKGDYDEKYKNTYGYLPFSLEKIEYTLK